MVMENTERQKKVSGNAASSPSMLALYHNSVFTRKLYTIDNVNVDIHNRIISTEMAYKEGRLGEADYKKQMDELRAAQHYFNNEYAIDYFRDMDFERDDEDRIIKVDDEKTEQIDLESVEAVQRKFLEMLRRGHEKDEEHYSTLQLYNLGLERKLFTCDTAWIDCHNRMADLYVQMEEELIDDFQFRFKLKELQDAMDYLNERVAKEHLQADQFKCDMYNRYVEIKGKEVKQIDMDQLKKDLATLKRDINSGEIEKQA